MDAACLPDDVWNLESSGVTNKAEVSVLGGAVYSGRMLRREQTG